VSFLGLEFASPALIEAVHDESADRTKGGRFTGLRTGTSWWRIEMRFEPRAFKDAAPALAVHRNRHGQSQPFQFPMPQMSEATNLPDAVTVGAKSAGTSTVQIQDGVLQMNIPTGHFVSFAGHAKVYQVQEAVSARGPLDIEIFPALVVDVADGVALSMTPNVTCVYERRSGGAWRVDNRNVVAPFVRIVET